MFRPRTSQGSTIRGRGISRSFLSFLSGRLGGSSNGTIDLSSVIKRCQDESLTFRSESSASATGQYLHLKVFLLRRLIVLGNRLVGGKPTIAGLSLVRYNEYAVKETISTLPIASQNRGIGQRAHGNTSLSTYYPTAFDILVFSGTPISTICPRSTRQNG